MGLVNKTFRVDSELAQDLEDYTHFVNDVKMQDVVNEALRKELELRFENADKDLREMLERSRKFRKRQAA